MIHKQSVPKKQQLFLIFSLIILLVLLGIILRVMFSSVKPTGSSCSSRCPVEKQMEVSPVHANFCTGISLLTLSCQLLHFFLFLPFLLFLPFQPLRLSLLFFLFSRSYGFCIGILALTLSCLFLPFLLSRSLIYCAFVRQVVRIRREAFPIRVTYKQFYRRFGSLVALDKKKGSGGLVPVKDLNLIQVRMPQRQRGGTSQQTGNDLDSPGEKERGFRI